MVYESYLANGKEPVLPQHWAIIIDAEMAQGKFPHCFTWHNFLKVEMCGPVEWGTK